MKSLNFLLNGLLSIFDIKQYIFFGSENSNSLTENEVKFHRRSFDTFDNFQPVKTFVNPLLMLNTPDPGVTKLADGTGWVAVATSNHASSHGNTSAFPMYFSPDLVEWHFRSWVFTSSNWPGWVKDRTWAPEVHFVNGRYIVYFTGGMFDGRLSCGAAIALSSDPFGPYKDIGHALVEAPESLGGAIDPHYFKDPVTGKDYLLWKADLPWSLQTSLIYIRELYFSGISFKDKARVLLRSNLKHIVEERLVAEAPWMMYKKGYYYLFYSSGWTFETKYHIRVARGRQVTGPFARTQRPVLTTDWERYNQGINCSFIGPGHGSIVDSGGDWWMIYHAWVYGRLNQEPGRVLMMDKVVWKEGWPIVGVPSDTPQHVPTIHPLQNV